MIFENSFLVFFRYLILKVISQEREIAAMPEPRNYTEGLEKLDIFFCTNYHVKEIVASHSLGYSKASNRG